MALETATANCMKHIPEPQALTCVRKFHEAFKVPVVESGPAIPPKERAMLRVSLLQEELNELKEAIEKDDVVEAADALADLQYVLSGAVLEFGMHHCFKDIFDEVQRSNMSKACATEAEAQETVQHYKQTKGVDATMECIGNSGQFLVNRIPDRKVLKSIRYSQPQLKPILFGHSDGLAVAPIASPLRNMGPNLETPPKGTLPPPENAFCHGETGESNALDASSQKKRKIHHPQESDRVGAGWWVPAMAGLLQQDSVCMEDTGVADQKQNAWWAPSMFRQDLVCTEGAKMSEPKQDAWWAGMTSHLKD